MSWKNLLAATAIADEGLQGLIGLEQSRAKTDLEAQKFNLLLAQAQSESDQASRKLTAEMLTSTFKESSDHYKTLLGSDIVNDPTMKPLLDNAFREYRNAKKSRDSFFGIETSPEMTAYELVQHELASLKGENVDPDMLRWTPKMRELLMNKYPDLDPNVLEGAEIIWKAQQSDATDAQRKAASNLISPTSLLGASTIAAGRVADVASDSMTLVGGLAESFLTGRDPRQTMQPGGLAFTKKGGPAEEYLRNLVGVAPYTQEQRGISAEEEIARMMRGQGSDASVSQLLPRSVIDALNQEDKKSIGAGTGGMLSFADDIKLSRKSIEFIKNLAMYEKEYGEAQGRKYVSKEFAKLSEKERAEVVEYLESQ
jgi:hypothetical protein